MVAERRGERRCGDLCPLQDRDPPPVVGGDVSEHRDLEEQLGETLGTVVALLDEGDETPAVLLEHEVAERGERLGEVRHELVDRRLETLAEEVGHRRRRGTSQLDGGQRAGAPETLCEAGHHRDRPRTPGHLLEVGMPARAEVDAREGEHVGGRRLGLAAVRAPCR